MIFAVLDPWFVKFLPWKIITKISSFKAPTPNLYKYYSNWLWVLLIVTIFYWLVIILEFVDNILCNHRLIENASKRIYRVVSLPSVGAQTCLIHKEQSQPFTSHFSFFNAVCWVAVFCSWAFVFSKFGLILEKLIAPVWNVLLRAVNDGGINFMV